MSIKYNEAIQLLFGQLLLINSTPTVEKLEKWVGSKAADECRKTDDVRSKAADDWPKAADVEPNWTPNLPL